MVVAVFVNDFNTKEANTAAIGVLRDRYDGALKVQLPAGSAVDWDVVGAGHRSVVRTELAGAGYATGRTSSPPRTRATTEPQLTGPDG